LDALWWLPKQILWLIWAALSWLIIKLFWITLWILLPVLFVAILSLRMAEYVLGKERVRTWMKRISLNFGAATWRRSRRLLFALGVLPLRVLGWLVFYTLWHSALSLWWTPRWSPWQRAWARRWRRRRRA
jgi:hypothetical protein